MGGNGQSRIKTSSSREEGVGEEGQMKENHAGRAKNGGVTANVVPGMGDADGGAASPARVRGRQTKRRGRREAGGVGK